MNHVRLVLAGLRQHRRAAVGVMLGFALASAILTGALFVGDSVRGSLRARSLASIGRVEVALVGGERNVRQALADELAPALSRTVAPVLQLPATAGADGGEQRANDVVLYGVDARFFELAPGASPAKLPGRREVLLNERLATQLAAKTGDSILVRVPAPSVISRDMLLATGDEASIGLRVTVIGIVDEAAFGRFALAASPLPPFGAFVDLSWLQAELELGGRVNLLLVGGGQGEDSAALAERADRALRERWQLEDAELELVELEGPAAGMIELRTPRVFLEDPIVEVASRFPGQTVGVLTYFVNALESAEGSTPYSMVAAIGPIGTPSLGPKVQALVPLDLTDQEIVVNQWLADDLGVTVGDTITLRYFVPGPDRALAEVEGAFRIDAVLPLEGLAADPSWMPDFPGITGSAHCRDWESGVPVDYDAVRDVDEDYWEQHRGTPKAFLNLRVGRRMWGNRWGATTAVRFNVADRATIAASLRAGIDPAALGLFFRDLRTPILASGHSATDFGGLFLGLSFFLIAAALALTALLFAFGVEQRAPEIGVLLALGFRTREVRRLFLCEAAILALVGAVLGSLLGTLYTRGVLHGLSTVWSGAVASSAVDYHARPETFAVGIGATFLTALGASWLALRRVLSRSALELLGTRAGISAAPPRAAGRSLAIGIVCLTGAVAIVLVTDADSGAAAAGAFFGAGALSLVAGLFLSRFVIARIGGARRALRSLGRLGLANAARRPARSLATVGLFASGTFLVLSIGVHRKVGATGAAERSSGTGGFALFGKSALPVFEDLATEAGRDAYGLDAEELEGVGVVSLRVLEGDDASCLNLGAPQRPQLVGVDARKLADLGAFQFAAGLEDGDREAGWSLLEVVFEDGALPAVADLSSAKWTMKKALGESFEYVDDRGMSFEVRLVGLIEDSILQGNLMVSATGFQQRFPDHSGMRMFLIDAPPDRREQISASLTRALEDEGLELAPAARRLDEFNAVQNAYLDVFQLLGALGLLLGSAGVGIVVMRNALERRSELALLRAVGYPARALRRLLAAEHLALFGLGLGVGTLAALLAVLPTSTGASWTSAAPWIGVIAINGVLWVLIAAACAARGGLLGALRSE